jgi:hypothetical protein
MPERHSSRHGVVAAEPRLLGNVPSPMGLGRHLLRRLGSIDRGAVDPERHRALTRIDRVDRVEGNRPPAPEKHIPPASHDLIGIVSMLLVANVIDHTDVPAIAREDEVTREAARRRPSSARSLDLRSPPSMLGYQRKPSPFFWKVR